MFEWWQDLTTINQWLYASALFFTLLFIWQMIAAFSGLSADHDAGGAHDLGAGGEHDFDAGHDLDAGHADLGAAGHHAGEAAADIHESLLAFKLFSIRSVMAFFTMFSWASALYLDNGSSLGIAVLLGVLWGLGGLLGVAVVFHFMRKMAETGTRRLSSCVGAVGTVYLQIPPGGMGEVRVRVSGVISLVKARGPGSGGSLPPGTPVKVVRVLAANMVQVAPETAPAAAG